MVRARGISMVVAALVLVAFEAGSTARSSSSLAAVLGRAGARRAGRVVPKLGVATVRGSDAAIRMLRRDPRVASVSREWYRVLRVVPNDPALHIAESASEWPGTAPGTRLQWALERENFYQAWDVATGGGARVAVLDTGVDGSHPDFAGKIASGDAVGTTDPFTDTNGHGTHTSGLACAATNNGRGVAGAGWGCRLTVVKLGSNQFGIPDDEIVAGIQLAADREAKTISMSFGGGGPSAALDRAINYAISRGAVLVAAASNNSTSDAGSTISASAFASVAGGDGHGCGSAGRAQIRRAARASSPRVPASYDLYMRCGRGRYRRLRKHTRRRSARLHLRPGTYRFYTRARDRAGNREAAPRRADARLVVRRPRR